jgi:large subunit ribosomal protein L4
MELKVIDNKGKESSTVQFDESLVQTKASKAVLHEVVVAHLANQRAGTHSALNRDEVSGGGIKPWKQKHTGRARAGSTRSPLWRHGGMIFAIKPRDYNQNLPKQKKKLAFRMAVNSLFEEKRIQVVEPVSITEPKTKNVAQIYNKWQTPTDSLFVVEKIEPNFRRASRNIKNVKVTTVESLNAYDCLKARRLYITPGAIDQLTARIKGN